MVEVALVNLPIGVHVDVKAIPALALTILRAHPATVDFIFWMRIR